MSPAISGRAPPHRLREGLQRRREFPPRLGRLRRQESRRPHAVRQSAREIIDDRYDDDGEILVALNKRNPEVFDVYRIDLNSKELTLVAENPGNITGWITDHAGASGSRSPPTASTPASCIAPTRTARSRRSSPPTSRQQISPLFFDFDNKLLFAASNIERDKAAIVRVDPATAKEESLIFEHPEVDVGGLDWSRKRKVCTEAQFATWKRERKFFDAEMQAIYADLERQLPGYEIDLQSSQQGRDAVRRRRLERPHPGRALPLRRGDEDAHQARRDRALARREANWPR